MDDLKKTKGYWKLHEEAIDRTVRKLAVDEATGLSNE
jgi:hypothetical protein